MRLAGTGWWIVGVIALAVGVAAAVTIEIDDGGGVTVRDPHGRVTVLRDGATDTVSDSAITPTPPTTLTPDAGPVSPSTFSFVPKDTSWPHGDGAIEVSTPSAEAWPAGADVLVLAWSEAQRRMVDGVALRFVGPPVLLSPRQLEALPPGRVELQALWRINGQTLEKTTHKLDVPAKRAAAADAGFTAWPLHPGARRVYVASAGDDANDGRSPDTPVKTLPRGLSLLRSGWGDHLLLRAGDTFAGGIGQWKWSGRDAEHPVVVGVYGQGDRPRIVTHGEGLLTAPMHKSISHVAFQGLHALPARRLPAEDSFDADAIPYREGGLWWMARGRNVHLEDCKIEGFQFNAVFQTNTVGGIENVTVRRCILTNSYSHWDGKVGGHSSGLFVMGVDGLVVEDSVFDHNGWAPAEWNIRGAKRTKFNHNLYIEQSSRSLVVRNNVIARGASYGLQLRPGGEATGNLFARNALGMYLAWHPSRVMGNVVAESDDQGDGPDDRRGYGIEVWPCEDALIAGNLVMHKRGSAGWAGAIEVTDFGSWKAEVPSPTVTVRGNTIVGWPVQHEKDAIVVRDGDAEVRELGNVLDVASGGSAMPRFARPEMTLDRAAGGSFVRWLERARSRPRGTWPDELTAAAINAVLFAAYSVIDE